MDIIFHCRKSLLFNNGRQWVRWTIIEFYADDEMWVFKNLIGREADNEFHKRVLKRDYCFMTEC